MSASPRKSDWYETAFGELYPVLYPHRDDAEAERAVAMLRGAIGDLAPVVDLGCGGGRYIAALRASSVSAFGVDLSMFLLREASARDAVTGRVVRGDMRALPFGTGVAGAVINMFSSFGYFETEAEHAQVIAEVARALRGGGVFVMDFINAAGVTSETVGTTRRAASAYDIQEERSIETHPRRVVKQVTATHRTNGEIVSYTERLRLFSVDEIVRFFEVAGFVVDRLAGDYDGTAFDPKTSSRAIVFGRRVGSK